jgi:hypothetical protein
MKKIPLTQGEFAIVDDADFDWLNQWKWCLVKGAKTFYANRGVGPAKNRRLVLMHRQILGLSRHDGKCSDHINHNGLDNRRNNLRVCSRQQNNRNRKPYPNELNTSKYKGVCWEKRRNKWRVSINISRKQIHVGAFNDEITAAKKYDIAAKKFFGEFAVLNFEKDNKCQK